MSKAKGNGKDKDGFQVVDGNAPKGGRKKKAPPAGVALVPKTERTAHLPGMEPVTIPEVHAAIEEYVSARDQRMALTKLETEKKAHLLKVMKAAGIPAYNVDGHQAEIETGEETVKARLDPVEAEEAEEAELSGGPRRPRAKSAQQPEAQA
jgi:hypothetical protein